MQISGYSYNDHLLFTSTFISPEENNYDDDSRNYFSLFMIFGYANGTDRTIDISDFFIYKENDESYPNFCEILYENFTIENNIYDYVDFNIIKLVSIPEEIILYKHNKSEEKLIQLENDYYISCDEVNNYIIKQNTNLKFNLSK